MERHDEREEFEEYLAAKVAATTANFSLGAPKEGFTPADFMRKRVQKAKPQKPRELIDQNIRCFLWGQVEAQKQAMQAQQQTMANAS